jgi:putative transposase
MLKVCWNSSGCYSQPCWSRPRPRQDLVIENLLLRHQLAVLTRPNRTRQRPRIRLWDKLLWVLARRLYASWRERLMFVTPDTIVRWHRQGWRLV